MWISLEFDYNTCITVQKFLLCWWSNSVKIMTVALPQVVLSICIYSKPIKGLFSYSVMSNSLWPCELQHARLSSLSPSPGVCSNSCLLGQWCHPTFCSCLHSVPASGSFKISRLFTSSGQNIGASASAFSHSNEYSGLISFRKSDWFDLLAVQGTLKSLLYHHSLKASSSALSLFYCPALTFIHD